MTNSLGGVHNSLGGGTVIFHRRGCISDRLYKHMLIFEYLTVTICDLTLAQK